MRTTSKTALLAVLLAFAAAPAVIAAEATTAPLPTTSVDEPRVPPDEPETTPEDPGTPPGDPGTPPGDPGTPPGDPGTPPGDQRLGDSGGCEGKCDPASPGEPFVPFVPPHKHVADTFDPTGKSKQEIAKHLTCGDKLGLLSIVGKDNVVAVSPTQSVKVIPVCEYTSLSGEQPTDLLHAVGNAAGLEPVIGANDTLHGALSHRGYRAGDVVGLFMHDQTVVLYVHKS